MWPTWYLPVHLVGLPQAKALIAGYQSPNQTDPWYWHAWFTCAVSTSCTFSFLSHYCKCVLSHLVSAAANSNLLEKRPRLLAVRSGYSWWTTLRRRRINWLHVKVVIEQLNVVWATWIHYTSGGSVAPQNPSPASAILPMVGVWALFIISLFMRPWYTIYDVIHDLLCLIYDTWYMWYISHLHWYF